MFLENRPPRQSPQINIECPVSLAKIKQENPDVGDFYTFSYIDTTINPTTTTPANTPIIQSTTSILHQTKEATENLLGNYLNDTITEMPIQQQSHLQTIQQMPSPISQSLTQPQPQPLQSRGKNITQVREIYEQTHQQQPPAKRKRVVIPEDHRNVGGPTRNDTLLKIGNKKPSRFLQRELTLVGVDGSEKKRKTVLTKNKNDIKCKSSKHYAAYEFITDQRRKALETIKEQRDILDKLP